jgi:hypothetical protein
MDASQSVVVVWPTMVSTWSVIYTMTTVLVWLILGGLNGFIFLAVGSVLPGKVFGGTAGRMFLYLHVFVTPFGALVSGLIAFLSNLFGWSFYTQLSYCGIFNILFSLVLLLGPLTSEIMERQEVTRGPKTH